MSPMALNSLFYQRSPIIALHTLVHINNLSRFYFNSASNGSWGLKPPLDSIFTMCIVIMIIGIINCDCFYNRNLEAVPFILYNKHWGLAEIWTRHARLGKTQWFRPTRPPDSITNQLRNVWPSMRKTLIKSFKIISGILQLSFHECLGPDYADILIRFSPPVSSKSRSASY